MNDMKYIQTLELIERLNNYRHGGVQDCLYLSSTPKEGVGGTRAIAHYIYIYIDCFDI